MAIGGLFSDGGGARSPPRACLPGTRSTAAKLLEQDGQDTQCARVIHVRACAGVLESKRMPLLLRRAVPYSLGHRSAWLWLCDGSPVSGATSCLTGAPRESSDIEPRTAPRSLHPICPACRSCHVWVLDWDRPVEWGRRSILSLWLAVRVDTFQLRSRCTLSCDMLFERFFLFGVIVIQPMSRVSLSGNVSTMGNRREPFGRLLQPCLDY